MSDLRDRLAAVIGDCRVFDEEQFRTNSEIADEVIGALGLREETVYAWNNNRSWPTATRHVTDWVPVDPA